MTDRPKNDPRRDESVINLVDTTNSDPTGDRLKEKPLPTPTPHGQETRVQDSLQKKQALAREAQVAIHGSQTPIPQHNRADPSLPQMMIEEETSDSQNAPQSMDDTEISYGGQRNRTRIMRVLSYMIVAGVGVYVGGKMCSKQSAPERPEVVTPAQPKPEPEAGGIKVQEDPPPDADALEFDGYDEERDMLMDEYRTQLEKGRYKAAFQALIKLQDHESGGILSITGEADRLYEDGDIKALIFLRRALKLGQSENPQYKELKIYVIKLIRKLKAESETEESEE